MAEVAALLRSAATLAVPAPLGAEPEAASEEPNHGTTAAEKKKKRKVMESESDDDKSAQAALQSAHQRHIADVQGPVEKAQQVLAYLNRVAGLRQRAHQLLHSFGCDSFVISGLISWLVGWLASCVSCVSVSCAVCRVSCVVCAVIANC
jgi:hypothetical protein